MMTVLLVPQTVPFLIALGLMLLMALLEIVSTTIGMGFSELVDSFLPDIDIDLDGATGPSSTGGLVKLLAWFRIGEVPVIMLFIIFLTAFGLIGLCLQFLCLHLIGFFVPTVVAVVLSFFLALPVVRSCGGVLGKYMPRDETYAVSEKSFYGKMATITLGTAQKGKPAQAKLHDVYGQTHYIMVEPDDPGQSFGQGEKVLIVSQTGALYTVIDASSAAMTEDD